MRKSGIYCIENLENGKKYIGQTVNLERRERKHFSSLKGNYHPNIHLQCAYNKYGEENFKFKILLCCKPSELTKYEQIFVDYYTSETLYNICTECVDSSLGTIHSKETKEKLSKANSGENNPNYGKHRSKETKRKMSEAKRGENNPNYGKHRSKETKRKLSMAQSGENNSNSKLTKNQVFEILDLYYNKNKKQTDIVKIFPVTSMAIFHIIKGKHWKSCYKKFMENNGKIKL